MTYDDWKTDPEYESERERKRRERAEWEEEHADYLREEEDRAELCSMEGDDE